MKVLHIELGRHLYGGARQVAYLLNGLSAHTGEHVLVSGENAAILQAIDNPKVTLHALPFAGDLDLVFIQRLRKLIRQEQPKLLHIHSRRGDILSALAGYLEGIPMLYSRRVDNTPNWLELRCKFPLFRRIVSISEGIREVLIQSGIEADRVICIPSAVDTHRYYPGGDRHSFRQEFQLTADQVVIGMIAQLIPRKGHGVLFKALPEVLARHPEVQVLIFGKGPLAAELSAFLTQQGWTDRVRMAGFRTDMERIIPCLDLLVHPAFMEGLGVSLLEAAAAGIPIIASRVGGIPEVVKPGINGELIAVNDSAALTEKLLQLLENPRLRHDYGTAGRQWVLDEFSIERMVRDNHRVYATLVSE